MPPYITTTNGAAVSFPFKFQDNNATFGGSGNALDPVVEDLVTKIHGTNGLRYGPEFWCMQITAGSGTYWSYSINGELFYSATLASKRARPEKYTTGFFVRTVTGKLAARGSDNQTERLLRDGGIAYPGDVSAVVVPEDGWVYFEMQVLNRHGSYEETDLSIMMTHNSVCYFALPRIMPGWVSIGERVSVAVNDRIIGV